MYINIKSRSGKNMSSKIKIGFFKSSLYPKNFFIQNLRSNGGRCRTSGRRILFSKGSFKRRVNTITPFDNYKWLYPLFIVVDFRNTTRRKIWFSSIISCFGLRMFIPTEKNHNLFKYLHNEYYYKEVVWYTFLKYFPYRRKLIKKKLDSFSGWHALFNVKPMTRIMFLANPRHRFPEKPTISLSPGSCSKLISWRYYKKPFSCYVRLPSTTIRLVSAVGGCVEYNNMTSFSYPNKMRRGMRYYKGARNLKMLGRHPVVRGVAKNPCDHPHGGTTNSIRLPRTPWGNIAKKSRLPKERRRWVFSQTQPHQFSSVR